MRGGTGFYELNVLRPHLLAMLQGSLTAVLVVPSEAQKRHEVKGNCARAQNL